MRPRFSIRTLLILTALTSAACYWWVARPAILARRFAAAIDNGQLAAADQMFANPGHFLAVGVRQHVGPGARVKPILEVRNWQDLCRGRQRVRLQIFNLPAEGDRLFDEIGWLRRPEYSLECFSTPLGMQPSPTVLYWWITPLTYEVDI